MKGIVQRIISGGRTGADRAALDWAIAQGISHSDWSPNGRKAEDGPIDRRYPLKETPRADHVQPTEWNVRDIDGTVIFTLAAKLISGSKKTAEFTRKHGKPCLHLSAEKGGDHALALRAFIESNTIKFLNVAGSRASKSTTRQTQWKQSSERRDITIHPLSPDA